jgi:hypothetical protein
MFLYIFLTSIRYRSNDGPVVQPQELAAGAPNSQVGEANNI